MQPKKGFFKFYFCNKNLVYDDCDVLFMALFGHSKSAININGNYFLSVFIVCKAC